MAAFAAVILLLWFPPGSRVEAGWDVATAPALQSRPTGTLGGLVLDGGSGRPVAGAVVRITRGVPDKNVWGEPSFRSVAESKTTTTDSAGRFEVNLPSGEYAVSVSRTDYPDTVYLRERAEDGPGATVRLAEHERRDITVKIWKDSSLEGAVVDEGGDPVIGVEVSALRRTFGGGEARYVMEARADTNDLGRYRFARLTPGEYIVAVASGSATWPEELVREVHDADQAELLAFLGRLGQSGAPAPTKPALSVHGHRFDWFGPAGRMADSSTSPGQPLVYHTSFHPGTRRVDSAAVVEVGLGQAVTNINIGLSAPVETHPVAGRLLGPDGKTGGVAVSLVPAELEGLASTRGFEIATAVTRGDGTFVMLGVPDGSYRLESTVGGRAWAPTPGTAASLLLATQISETVLRAPNRSDESIYTATAQVTVAGDAVADATLTLRRGLRVSGRITIPTTSNAPPATDVADTIVYLQPVDRAREGSMVTARPDQAGNFVTPEYVPGRYRLVLSRVNRQWRIAQMLVNGDDVIDGVIDLRDEDVTDVAVTLTDKEAILSGTVLGDSAGHLRVVVFPADVERWIARGTHPAWATNRHRTNNVGEFTVTNLLPGRYCVVALRSDVRIELTNPDWLRQMAKRASQVDVRWGTNSLGTLRVTQVQRR